MPGRITENLPFLGLTFEINTPKRDKINNDIGIDMFQLKLIFLSLLFSKS